MNSIKNIKKTTILFFISILVLAVLVGCKVGSNTNTTSTTTSGNANFTSFTTTTVSAGTKIYNYDDMFTSRDLKQEADLTGATTYEVKNDEDITITKEGVYVISGTSSNTTIYVEALDTEKVQIVLNGVNITNDSMPCIYIKEADKVFITTTNTENSLKVTGTFATDGTTNLDGTIFSRSDIVLNGKGTLNIESTDKGIVGKDDIKITGGTYNVSSTGSAIRANDSIRVSDGTINITDSTDGLHAENNDDDTKGYIYISGGTFNIKVTDDCIHATLVIEIDDGTFILTGAEGLEGTYIQVNGGKITINASDDGINAAQKSSSYTPTFELNGGEISITMGTGDTDGVDSNGNIVINGGSISVNGNSTFDYDGQATYNGGTIIVNGTQTNTIPSSMMGGGRGGMMNGQMGGQRQGRNFDMSNTSGDSNFFRGSREPKMNFGSGERMPFENGQMPEDMPQMQNGERPNDMPEMPSGAQFPNGQMPQDISSGSVSPFNGQSQDTQQFKKQSKKGKNTTV